jgi:hypothetical protein
VSDDFSRKVSFSFPRLNRCISLLSISLSPWFSTTNCWMMVSCSDSAPKEYNSRNILAIFDIFSCNTLFSLTKADVVCCRFRKEIVRLLYSSQNYAMKCDMNISTSKELTRSAVKRLSYSRCNRNTASLCEFCGAKISILVCRGY